MKIILIFLLLVFNFQVFAQTSINISYKGKVIDSHSKEGVSFASILIINKSSGTTTDLQGNFEIRIENSSSSEILVSCIGYKDLIVKIKDFNADTTTILKLAPQTYQLEAVTVESKKIPLENILSQTIGRIKQNYYQSAFSFDMYSNRELRDFENNNPILNQMIVAEGYYETGYKTRKAAHNGNNTFYNVTNHKLNGLEKKYSNYDYGLFTGYGLIILDIVRHENSPLNEANFKDFDFRIDKISEQENDSIYSISFASKKTDYKNSAVMAGKKYSGVIYISLPDYAVVKFEGSVLLDKDKRFTSQRDFIDDPKFSFTVFYGLVNGKYVFDYAKSSMIIYDGLNKLRFDQEFIPYNFNFTSPKKLAKSNLDFSKMSNPNFWSTYEIPKKRKY